MMTNKSIEQVNHPTHYNSGKIEVIDFIEDQNLNFCLGNVVKYICRAGKKNSGICEDLNKAKWYLEHEINKLNMDSPNETKTEESIAHTQDDINAIRDWKWHLTED